MRLGLLLLLISLFSCLAGDGSIAANLAKLPKDEQDFQKMIISQLSGETAIVTPTGDEVFLNSRWNKRERRISRGYLEAMIKQLNLVPYLHHYSMANPNQAVDLILEPLAGTNLYTILPATTQSDEYIVIGAHYDTDGENFPGAIDNGSGVALISSVLRQLQALPRRSKHLMVVYFDQEEESISAGSIAFAEFLQSEQLNIHSVHSYDLIGWDGDNNKEVQLELPSPEIEAAYKRQAEKLTIPLLVTQSKSSDYYSFIKAGINAVGISQAYAKGDWSGKKDSPEDKYHLVNFTYLESSTDLAVAVLKDLMNDQSN